MKIYVVTEGQYSDYRILGVFSTEEKAKEYVDLCSGDIEEFELDDMPVHPPGMLAYSVDMKRNGDVVRVSRFSAAYFTQDNKVSYCEGVATFRVWAESPEHAVKICGEKRTQLLAANEWPEWKEYPPVEGLTDEGLLREYAELTTLDVSKPFEGKRIKALRQEADRREHHRLKKILGDTFITPFKP